MTFRARYFAIPAVALPLLLNAATARAQEATPVVLAGENVRAGACIAPWIPATEALVGLGLATTGVLSFNARFTGRNPTMPALTTGLGAGAGLSGLALIDANRRCAAGDTVSVDWPSAQRRVAWATAGMATLALGMAGAMTLTHEPGVGTPSGAYEMSALLMTLAAAGTVVGVNILLMPQGVGRARAAGSLRVALSPIAGGGAAAISFAH